MQLLCRASGIEGEIAIEPPVDSTYLVYPPELILTNLVVEMLVVSIAGEILVLSVSLTPRIYYFHCLTRRTIVDHLL
jgi:hypothetical protein